MKDRAGWFSPNPCVFLYTFLRVPGQEFSVKFTKFDHKTFDCNHIKARDGLPAPATHQKQRFY